VTNEDRDARLTQLLDELGPADPPSGFTRQVMARVERAGGGVTGRILAFGRGGVAMTKKAMWGIAAAAAAVLVVFVVRGFPTVDRGTEGTIGAAKKYQAPQIAENDVVLADPAAQQFLQSETFDHLIKDPQARTLLSNPALMAELKRAEFTKAIRDEDIRATLHNDALARLFDDALTRNALEDLLRANASAAVKQASAEASLKRNDARGVVEKALKDPALGKALREPAVREAMAKAEFRKEMARNDIADAMHSAAFLKAIQDAGFSKALYSNRLASELAAR